MLGNSGSMFLGKYNSQDTDMVTLVYPPRQKPVSGLHIYLIKGSSTDPKVLSGQ